MNESCPGCMRLENLILKLKKENASLKSRLKQSPVQAMNNMRAEFQEMKDMIRGLKK